MKRIFTQTVSGRYKQGQIRDWPMSTWNGLANSLKMDLDDFSNPRPDETYVAIGSTPDDRRSIWKTPDERVSGRPRKDDMRTTHG